MTQAELILIRQQILRARGVPEDFIVDIAARAYTPPDSKLIEKLVLYSPIVPIAFFLLLDFEAFYRLSYIGKIMNSDIFSGSSLAPFSFIIAAFALFPIPSLLYKYFKIRAHNKMCPSQRREQFLNRAATRLFTLRKGQKISKRLFSKKLAGKTNFQNADEFLLSIKKYYKPNGDSFLWLTQKILTFVLGVLITALVASRFSYWNIHGNEIAYQFFGKTETKDLRQATKASAYCIWQHRRRSGTYPEVHFDLYFGNKKIGLFRDNDWYHDYSREQKLEQIAKISNYLVANKIMVEKYYDYTSLPESTQTCVDRNMQGLTLNGATQLGSLLFHKIPPQ